MNGYMWWSTSKNTRYKTGAERESEEGKLRVDLVPYDIIDSCRNKAVSENIPMEELLEIYPYQWVLDWQLNKDKHGDLHRILCLFIYVHMNVPCALESLAFVMTEGLKKYPKDNWKNGISRCVNSLTRHYLAFQNDESNLEHLGGMLFNALAIVYYIEQGLE